MVTGLEGGGNGQWLHSGQFTCGVRKVSENFIKVVDVLNNTESHTFKGQSFISFYLKLGGEKSSGKAKEL